MVKPKRGDKPVRYGIQYIPSIDLQKVIVGATQVDLAWRFETGSAMRYYVFVSSILVPLIIVREHNEARRVFRSDCDIRYLLTSITMTVSALKSNNFNKRGC